MLDLARQGDVWVLTMNHGENRFNNESLTHWEAALDQLETCTGPAALVVTSSDPKFFSNGIDLEPLLKAFGRDYFYSTFAPRLDRMFLRLARLPMPVAMAINGHAYAGGAIMAACADIRFMRADRGRYCFPEVNISVPFSPCMMEIVRTLPNPGAVWEMVSTGAAWGGDQAAARGVIEHALAEEAVLPTAMAWAQEMAKKDRDTFTRIKRLWKQSLEQFV